MLMQFLTDDDRILNDPEPTVVVRELADNGVNFAVRSWVNRTDYWATRCELTEKIKLGFDERGFSIPYPTRDVHLHGGLAAATAG